MMMMSSTLTNKQTVNPFSGKIKEKCQTWNLGSCEQGENSLILYTKHARLTKTINSFVQFVDMNGISIIEESQGLCNIHIILQLALKEGIVDVKLANRPPKVKCKIKNKWIIFNNAYTIVRKIRLIQPMVITLEGGE